MHGQISANVSVGLGLGLESGSGLGLGSGFVLGFLGSRAELTLGIQCNA